METVLVNLLLSMNWLLPTREFSNSFFRSISITKKITKEFWVKRVYRNNVQKNIHGYCFDAFIVDSDKFFSKLFIYTERNIKTSIYFKERSTWLK